MFVNKYNVPEYKNPNDVPRLKPNTLRIIPLGGLGEIGRNMTIFEYNDNILVVDCGVLFPDSEQPGIDLILPDFSYIEKRLNKINGVFLTHGHEDHIGALPYLIAQNKEIQILGSKLTLALVENKFKEHRIIPKLLTVKENETRKIGPFELSFIAVNHSIPDALAVAVKVDGRTVLCTGDIKLDQTPLDGRLTDLNAFAELAKNRVDLFMVDSTNAINKGFLISEKEIAPELDRLIRAAKGKVLLASFASHIHRIQSIINAAVNAGRRVAVVGRSMKNNIPTAHELGYLEIPDNVLIDIKDVNDLPDDKIVVICTGSQGETMAAMSRISRDEFPLISVTPNDTVIMASSNIPGNEKSINKVINIL
ncbi:MAG: ribonuclease J [Bifidobacteriaceae bacterium]|jgi:ribonuclease J|nr:ribonuclease J [Bifidobacteriaceae bacterium]